MLMYSTPFLRIAIGVGGDGDLYVNCDEGLFNFSSGLKSGVFL